MPDPATPGPKPDVFISYARPDRARAQSLAEALAGAGLAVWWDRNLEGGQDFADVIAEQLDAARIVIVLWSRAAVASDFVRDEATRARQAGKLLPVRIEAVQPPLGFGTIHTLDLIGWDGDADDAAFQVLLADVRRGAGNAGPAPPPPPAPWWRRWRRPLVAAAVVVAGGVAGYAAWDAWREQQALRQLQVGLEAHFARDRNLQVARNAYLSALRDDPKLGRAHYYLGHVYALLVLPRDARTHFALALRFSSDLDAAQREDAQAQLAALGDVDAVAPVTRAAPTTSGSAVATAPAPAAAPRPGSVAEPVRPPAPGATAGATAGATTGATTGAITGGAITATSTRLPRLPPSPERQRTIESRATALFSPDAQTRLEAATALAVDPGLAADAMPLAIDRSLAALRDSPGSVATATGVANTMQLLLAASPATLRAHADGARRLAAAAPALGDNQRAAAQQLQRLVDQAASEKPPVAYIQIASDAQRELARSLAARIRASGYTVPALEKVGDRAPAQTEVRVQGGSAPGWGRWLAKVVGETTGETAQISTLRAARPANDTFEIWLDKDLCVTRRVPACGD